jgi:hypothetical protein
MLVKALETNNVISAVQLVPQELLDTSILLKNEAALNLNILTSPISKAEAIKSVILKKCILQVP